MGKSINFSRFSSWDGEVGVAILSSNELAEGNMSTTVSFSSSRISCDSSACQPPVLDLRIRSSAYFLIVEPFLSQSLVKIIDNIFVLVHTFAVSSTSHVRSRGMTRNRKRNANQQEAASRCIRMCKTCLWIAWPLILCASYVQMPICTNPCCRLSLPNDVCLQAAADEGT